MLQLVKKVTTEITVDDKILVYSEYDYEETIPKSTPKTQDELEAKARNYISYTYGQWPGHILGQAQHIYRETGCPFITIPRPKGFKRVHLY